MLDIILYVYVISFSFKICYLILDAKCGEIIRHRKKKSDFMKGQNNSNLRTTLFDTYSSKISSGK